MFKPPRLIWILPLALAGFAVWVTGDSIAEPPPSEEETAPSRVQLELPLKGEIPSAPLKFDNDSPASTKIRDALGGDLPADAPGDPVLDDVLQIIKQRGSILDGSSLDSSSPDSETERAHAAEVLLRAARLLERVQPAGKDRRELVNRMRAEAVKLLAD